MDKDQIRTEAYSRFEDASSSEFDNRKKAINDIKFAQLEDNQWDDDAKNRRRNRPRYTINKIATAVNQVIGEQRQARVAVKVLPAKGNATLQIANTYNGLIRNIESVSKAKNAYDMAFKYVVNGGFGAWRIVTEYTDEDTFDQDIRIKQISSPLTQIWFDPLATDVNKRDARFVFISYDVDLAEFGKLYPNASASDFSNPTWTNSYNKQWFTTSTVRVAEYYVKKPVEKKICLLTDGRTIDFKEYEPVADELAALGVTIVEEEGKQKIKTVKCDQIFWYKLSGAEILEGPKKVPGKFIPIVPVYGFNFYMNNAHYYRGMVRLAKDAQRVYNYTTSAKVEATALTPKDPYWLTAKQAEGQKKQLQNFNVENNPFLFYTPDPQAPGPPARTGAPAVQQALIEQTQQADQDIKATTGKFAPSIGDNPRDESGRAIIAQQQKGEAATYELIDNLVKAIEYTGEILVDLIPRIYDTERQARIIKDDGESEVITVNQTIIDRQTGRKVILNDLSQGKYDVVSSVGPSSATKRTESLKLLMDLAMASPVFAQVSSDLLAKNIDSPFADELTARVRRVMLSQGLIEPNEKEKKEMPPPDPMQEKIAQQQYITLENENLLSAAKIDKLAAENEKMKIDNLKTRAEVIKTLKGDPETVKTPEEIEAMQKAAELLNFDLEQEITEDEKMLRQEALKNMQMKQQQQMQQQGMPQQGQGMNQGMGVNEPV